MRVAGSGFSSIFGSYSSSCSFSSSMLLNLFRFRARGRERRRGRIKYPVLSLNERRSFIQGLSTSFPLYKTSFKANRRTAEYRISNPPAADKCRRVESLQASPSATTRQVAQSYYKIDRSTQKLTTGRIHSFDIRHSLFDIRYSLFQSFFSI